MPRLLSVLVNLSRAAFFFVVVGLGAFGLVSILPSSPAVELPKSIFLADTTPPAVLQTAPPPIVHEAQSRETVIFREKPVEAAGAAAAPNSPAPEPPAQVPPPSRVSRREFAALPQGSTASPPRPQSPVAPQPPAPAQNPRYKDVLTPSEIRRLKLSLRLTSEQEAYWPPVEAVLTEIGAQQMALARAGQNTADAFSGTTFRIYSAARPLIGLLREDQKAQIRNKARSMGLESVAAYL
ncbi:hypothetical protein [Methylobacterium longum]|uniref:Uncharacterized protein n=1 Tax=Methylobacterium longum TaxID=767694 RepID=A0ABT8ANY7_9HYPH|nr:hypothetical protein [Methylobacterium longum]MDN3571124.1 hypothetical protein [Methylobacterium longum]GJE15219.1 hypothetical protein FOHLNKBM_6297 [Methylobacterium longum]